MKKRPCITQMTIPKEDPKLTEAKREAINVILERGESFPNVEEMKDALDSLLFRINDIAQVRNAPSLAHVEAIMKAKYSVSVPAFKRSNV